MKSLQEFGVQELKTNELTLVNGGSIITEAIELGGALIANYIANLLF